MKTKNTKIMIKALPLMAFLTSLSAAAKTTHPQVLQQDPDGPQAPPGVSIDGYLLLLVVVAIVFAGMYFYKIKKQSSTIL